jgi:hypothetical protein
MMFSAIPVFAANNTNDTSGQVAQDKNCIPQDHKFQHGYKNSSGTCDNSGTCTCDLQKKNQYGKKNNGRGADQQKEKCQYGLKKQNSKTCTGNCQNK